MSRRQYILLWSAIAWPISAFCVQAITWWMGGSANWPRAIADSVLILGVFIALWAAGIASADSTAYRDRFLRLINEYSKWLSMYPQASRVLDNLRAEMECEVPINAGTPVADENCTLPTLRQQLEKLERKVIRLTPHEIQSGLSRVRYAELLIKQLPETHEGRNSWLLNYGEDRNGASR